MFKNVKSIIWNALFPPWIQLTHRGSDILINFMECSGKIEGRFQWPKHKDGIWREKQSIFWKHSGPPESIGKTKRSFAISDDDLTNIKLAFQNYMKLIRK